MCACIYGIKVPGTTHRAHVRLAVLILIAAVAGGAFSQVALPEPPAAGDTPEAHLGRGYDALKEDKYETAVSEFRSALQLDPTLVLRARFPLAVALFESHKAGEAR